MAQKLILPINKARVTAGYKNSQYRREFGFNHYGADMTDVNRKDYTVWASGNGEVVASGYDSKTGNTVVIIYRDCLLTDGRTMDIVQRMWHFDKVYVKKGQKVTKDTKVGLYGDTGVYASGKHLHHEYDSDCKYPCHSPSFAGNTSIIKAGTDTTLNPNKVLWVKKTAPDYQSIVGSSSSDCYTSADIDVKVY